MTHPTPKSPLKSTLSALGLTILVALPLASFANPSATSLERLAEVTSYEAVFFDEVVAPLSYRRAQLAQSLQADQTLTQKQRDDALKIFDTYAENLLKTLDTPQTQAELKSAFISAAKQHFTQAEVDAQVAFYGSASGKSALQKRDAVLERYLKGLVSSAQVKIDAYEKAHLAKMEADLKSTIGK